MIVAQGGRAPGWWVVSWMLFATILGRWLALGSRIFPTYIRKICLLSIRVGEGRDGREGEISTIEKITDTWARFVTYII